MTNIESITLNVLADHCHCVDEVYANEYYIPLFELTLQQKNLNKETVKQFQTVNEVFKFWNMFWFNLPDHKSIRVHPFFLICDLAEGDYLYDSDHFDDEIM